MNTFFYFMPLAFAVVFLIMGCVLNAKKIHHWYKNITFKDPIPDQWKDEPVKYLIRCQWEEESLPDFIVYIDYEDDLNWVRGNKKTTNLTDEDTKLAEQVFTKVSFQEIRIKNWDADIKLQINRLLGEVIVKAFHGEDASDALKNAEEFIERKLPEVSRAWILRYSLLTTATVSLLTLFPAYCLIQQASPCEDSNQWLINTLLVLGMGALGAFYSVLLRLGTVIYDTTSEKQLHLYEAAARIFVGSVSGFVSLLLLKANVVAPSFFNESNFASILLFAFISGVSERLIPSIISVVESKKK